MERRGQRRVGHACLVAATSLALCACGSSRATAEGAEDADADAGTAVDAPPDSRRDAPTDTGAVHGPKAPRCSDGDAGVPDAPGSDGGDAPSADAADPDAPIDVGDVGDVGDSGEPVASALPRVVSSGGPVLRSPRVVAVTFDGEPNRDDIEDFVASFGCTPYWRAIATEYGVGDAVGGAPVHVAEPPPVSITDRQIEKWLRGKLDGKAPGWEPPVKDSLYAVYYPMSSTVMLGTLESCVGFGGFHKSFTLGDGTSVSYAVIVDCEGDLDNVTAVSSHEFIEAATDPQPGPAPAFQRVDDDHAVYGLRTGSEVGDMCEQIEGGGAFFPADYPFQVQRSWSNVAAKNLHDPCVPAPLDPYFNTTPELPDTVSVGFAFADTKGVKIPVGGERTIWLQLYADGPVDAWTLQAKDISGEAPHLSFSFDRTTGKSGDRIALTIRKKSESSKLGAEPFAIYSSNSKHRHVSYGVVGH